MLEIMNGWARYELKDLHDMKERAHICGVLYEDFKMSKKANQDESVTIHWHDTLLELPKWIVERYEEENISLDEAYLDNLYIYHRPMFSFQTELKYSNEFTSLLIANRYRISARKSLGKLVMYDSHGNSVALFDNLYEIVCNENYRWHDLGYETFDKGNMFPEKVAKQRQRRGLPVVEPTEKGTLMLLELNDYKRNMFAWFYGVRAKKCFTDGHRSPLLNNYTFEEFRKQHCKAISMEFYRTLAASIRYFENSNKDKIKRQKIPLAPYHAALTKLLRRYTFKGTPLLKEVTDLNEYKSYAGIYILCLTGVRGYYIGQTAASLTKRNQQHWRKPGTDFDRKYCEADVADIYVMPFDIAEVYGQMGLDAIERDCIASIPKKYLLNCLIGGTTTIRIKDNDYKQVDFRLTKDVLADLKDRIWCFQKENGLF